MNYTELVKKLTSSGMTQKKIAARAGVTQGAISKIERGLTTDPRASLGAAIEKMVKGIRK